MSHRSLEENLKKYYGRQAPAPELVERLKAEAAEAGRDATAVDGKGSRARVFRGRWAVAASFALVLTAAGYVLLEQRSDEAVDYGVAGTPPSKHVTEIVEQADPALDFDHRLVAVKVHHDFCPRCPLIAPVFDRLAEKYQQEPVTFVTLDLTTLETRRDAARLTRGLGIEWIQESPYQTGMIKVVDRDSRRVLSVLTDVAQESDLESVLTEELARNQ